MKPAKKALIGNLILLFFTTMSVAWIISGISYRNGPLDGPNLASLRYYTVDSNILMGIAALAAAVEEGMILKGKRKALSFPVRMLKLSGTVCVTLTMMITVFFLTPTLGRAYGYQSLYANSAFFMHVFNPICSILVWVLLERSDRISLRQTPLALIPTVLYAVYYLTNCLTHVENGSILPGYDWYGFFFLGLNSWIYVYPVILLITYSFVLILWKWNRKKPHAGL